MALVGDPIIRARILSRDPCMTLVNPAAPTLAAAAIGGTLSGTIYCVITWSTNWGETVASGETSVLVSGGNNGVQGIVTPPPGATAGRLYYGTAVGAENQWVPINLVGGNTQILSLSAGVAGFPPVRNRAYLPDTDGLVQASELWKWLDLGLLKMGQITGGILDEGGVAWPSGQAEAVLPGAWYEFTDMWHNGWVVLPERAEFTWLKSTLSGIPGIATVWKNAAQQVVGLWPQPGTPGATTVLTGNVGLTTDPFPVSNSANFIAPGLMQVDSEVMSFTSIADSLGNNDQLGLLVRGLSGSIPATHLNGATVTQLIFRFRGYRAPTIYQPGQSTLTLDLPTGWDEILDLYMLAKYKEFEQNRAEAKDLMGEFEAGCLRMRDNKLAPYGVRQIGWVAPFVGDSENLETLIGTILIP